MKALSEVAKIDARSSLTSYPPPADEYFSFETRPKDEWLFLLGYLFQLRQVFLRFVYIESGESCLILGVNPEKWRHLSCLIRVLNQVLASHKGPCSIRSWHSQSQAFLLFLHPGLQLFFPLISAILVSPMVSRWRIFSKSFLSNCSEENNCVEMQLYLSDLSTIIL